MFTFAFSLNSVWNRQLKCFVFTVVHFGFIFLFRERRKKNKFWVAILFTSSKSFLEVPGIYSVSTRFSFAFDDDERVGPAPTTHARHSIPVLAAYLSWKIYIFYDYVYLKNSPGFLSLSLSLVTCCTQRIFQRRGPDGEVMMMCTYLSLIHI